MIAQPKFKWGISTLGCHELTLEETCSIAEKFDVHAIEVRSLADRQDVASYLDEAYPNAEAIQEVLDKHHQTIVALNSGFKLIGSQEVDRKELLDFTRWANALGIPFIRVFGGGSMNEELSIEDLDEAAANLLWWSELKLQNGWTTRLALETHDGFCSAQRCLDLINHTASPLDIIWDTHHTWKLGNESPEHTWREIAQYIKHVHIKDSIPVPSARHPYTYVLPGTGNFPAIETLDLLTDQGYEGIVSLEWERKWHPYLPEIGKALEHLESKGWRKEALAIG